MLACAKLTTHRSGRNLLPFRDLTIEENVQIFDWSLNNYISTKPREDRQTAKALWTVSKLLWLYSFSIMAWRLNFLRVRAPSVSFIQQVNVFIEWTVSYILERNFLIFHVAYVWVSQSFAVFSVQVARNVRLGLSICIEFSFVSMVLVHLVVLWQ